MSVEVPVMEHPALPFLKRDGKGKVAGSGADIARGSVRGCQCRSVSAKPSRGVAGDSMSVKSVRIVLQERNEL